MVRLTSIVARVLIHRGTYTGRPGGVSGYPGELNPPECILV